MGVGMIFSRGATRVFFQNFSIGVPKVVKFVFSHWKLRKQPFVLKLLKSKGAKVTTALPLPTPMISMGL